MRRDSLSTRLLACILILIFAFSGLAASKASKTYDKAVDKMAEGKYEEAAKLFDSISAYEDATLQAMYCKALAYGANENYSEAIKALEFLGDFKDSAYLRTYFSICRKAFSNNASAYDIASAANEFDKISIFRDSAKKADECRQLIYEEATDYFNQGEYDFAANYFYLIENYKDSKAKIETCITEAKEEQYQSAVSLMEAGEYDNAIEIFKELGNYKDSRTQTENCLTAKKEEKYQKANSLLEKGQYTDALSLFKELKEYKDSTKIVEDFISSTFEPGSTIEFGSYKQTFKVGRYADPIEWLVLAREDDKALLISKYALDSKKYNDSYSDITWENCSLRYWLNDEFFNKAFNNDEQSQIIQNKNTSDKVFLLSVTEAQNYFSSDIERQCKPTEYGERMGCDLYNGNCYWWLSTDNLSNYGSIVNYDGSIKESGSPVNNKTRAVRPSLWINIDRFMNAK